MGRHIMKEKDDDLPDYAIIKNVEVAKWTT